MDKIVNAINEIQKIDMQVLCKDIIDISVYRKNPQEMNIMKISEKVGLPVEDVIRIVTDLAVSGFANGLYVDKYKM